MSRSYTSSPQVPQWRVARLLEFVIQEPILRISSKVGKLPNNNQFLIVAVLVGLERTVTSRVIHVSLLDFLIYLYPYGR
jgi:hypothetical protein